jgi:hypothetical protein
LAIAHDPDFGRGCSDATSLGGWIPMKFDDYEERMRFDASMCEWRQVATSVYAVAVETVVPVVPSPLSMAMPEESLTITAGSTKRSGPALPVLSLTKYRHQRFGPPGQGRVWICADFKLRPKKAIVDGVIYQTVQLMHSIDGV